MSKIPVEKKRSALPWWGWLLIAIAVIVALWLVWPLITGEAGIGLVAPALATLLLPPPRPTADCEKAPPQPCSGDHPVDTAPKEPVDQ